VATLTVEQHLASSQHLPGIPILLTSLFHPVF
jgi:hypothetical protein